MLLMELQLLLLPNQVLARARNGRRVRVVAILSLLRLLVIGNVSRPLTMSSSDVSSDHEIFAVRPTDVLVSEKISSKHANVFTIHCSTPP
jgi:hypothetical protein